MLYEYNADHFALFIFAGEHLWYGQRLGNTTTTRPALPAAATGDNDGTPRVDGAGGPEVVAAAGDLCVGRRKGRRSTGQLDGQQRLPRSVGRFELGSLECFLEYL